MLSRHIRKRYCVPGSLGSKKATFLRDAIQMPAIPKASTTEAMIHHVGFRDASMAMTTHATTKDRTTTRVSVSTRVALTAKNPRRTKALEILLWRAKDKAKNSAPIDAQKSA